MKPTALVGILLLPAAALDDGGGAVFLECGVVMSKTAKYDGLGLTPGSRPSKPMKALPGTLAKLHVMIERVERGEMPHHPDDARDWKGTAGDLLLLRPESNEPQWHRRKLKGNCHGGRHAARKVFAGPS
jgi:hypothetical protein